MRRGEEYAEEFVAVMKLIEEDGLRLRRRSSKGKGHFIVEDLHFRTVTSRDIRKRAGELEKKGAINLHFISDVVGELNREETFRGKSSAPSSRGGKMR